MKVVALMPTFNRAEQSPHLLAEAVGSFLAQDHGDKMLVIGNDTPGQTLRCDHEQVFVVNYGQRFSSLGAKIQSMALLANRLFKPGAFCRWDDDDYNLPWRLSLSVEQLQLSARRAGTGQRLEWRPSNYWWFRQGLDGEVWEVERAGNTHCMAIWRPEVLDLIGGYPQTTGDEDQAFNAKLEQHDIVARAGWGNLPHERIFYVYRWGVSPRHLSGGGGSREKLDAQYAKIGTQEIAQGAFEIEPTTWELPSLQVGLDERQARHRQLQQQGRA